MPFPKGLRFVGCLAEHEGAWYFQCNRLGHNRLRLKFNSRDHAERFLDTHRNKDHRLGKRQTRSATLKEIAATGLLGIPLKRRKIYESKGQFGHYQCQVPPITKGSAAELVVAADLLNKGFEVYRSLSHNASCDLAVRYCDYLFGVEVRKISATHGMGIPKRPAFDIIAFLRPGGEIIYAAAWNASSKDIRDGARPILNLMNGDTSIEIVKRTENPPVAGSIPALGTMQTQSLATVTPTPGSTE